MEPNNEIPSLAHDCIVTSNTTTGVHVDSFKNEYDKKQEHVDEEEKRNVVVDHFIPLLPWNVIIEFWSIQDILKLRLVSRNWNLQIISDNVSPNQCAKYLSSILIQQNLYLLNNTTCTQWMDSTIQPNNVDKLTHMLSTAKEEDEDEEENSPIPIPIPAISGKQEERRRKQQTTKTDSDMMMKPSSIVVRNHSNGGSSILLPMDTISSTTTTTTTTFNSAAALSMSTSSSLPSSKATKHDDTDMIPRADSNTATNNPLRTLLRILRIIQYIPEQAAIAFNKSYGRHILPMEWDEHNNIMIVVKTKKNLVPGNKAANITNSQTNCQGRIPTTPEVVVAVTNIISNTEEDNATNNDNGDDNDMGSSLTPPPYPSNNIDDYFTIPASSTSAAAAAATINGQSASSTIQKTPAAQAAHVPAADSAPTTSKSETFHQILDLKHYYNTNVTNLPNDLSCPRCGSVLVNENEQQQGDVKPYRSLVLSEISYQSSSSKSTTTVPTNDTNNGDGGDDITSPCHVDLTLTPQLLNRSKQNNHGGQTSGVNSHIEKISGEVQRSSRPCDTVNSFYEDKDGDVDDDGSIQFDSLFTSSSPLPTIPRKRPKIDGVDGGDDTKQIEYQVPDNEKIGGKPTCSKPRRRKEKETNDINLEGKQTDVIQHQPDFAQLPTFPPPTYCDMAMPCRTTPIPYKPDNKHAISLHCTSCNEFGILAPASICWDPNFPCHQRGMYLTDRQHEEQGQLVLVDGHQASTASLAAAPSVIGHHQETKDPTMVGGMLVRTRCSTAGCDRPTLCWQCHHSIWHHPYDDGGTNWMNFSQANLGSPTVRHSSHCPSCRETYCHEHAWLCTICHHW